MLLLALVETVFASGIELVVMGLVVVSLTAELALKLAIISFLKLLGLLFELLGLWLLWVSELGLCKLPPSLPVSLRTEMRVPLLSLLSLLSLPSRLLHRPSAAFNNNESSSSSSSVCLAFLAGGHHHSSACC